MEATKKGIAAFVERPKQVLKRTFSSSRDDEINDIAPEERIVLVTCGSAAVGFRVALKLLESNNRPKTVRVGTRYKESDIDQESLAQLLEKGAESVHFNWKDTTSYADALEGVTTVFANAPGMVGLDDVFPEFIKSCQEAKVKHVVKLSFYHAMHTKDGKIIQHDRKLCEGDPFAEVPLVQMHGTCDKILTKSSLGYTILFPSHDMSNPLRFQGDLIKEEHKFYGASSNKGVNYVSPNSIADVGVCCIVNPKDHVKKGYTITSPAAITDKQVATLIGKQLDTTVQYVDDYTRAIDLDYATLEHIKASGIEEGEEFATRDCCNCCGHEAESFEEYLEHQEYMTAKELAVFK